VLAEGKVAPEDLRMFRVLDDPHEAVAVMLAAEQHREDPRPGGGESPVDAERPD
jgi:hypothetical protein